MLAVLVLCSGCSWKHVAALIPEPEQPLRRVILANDLPGEAQLCVQLPDNALLDSVNVDGPRLACWGTVGQLRATVIGQQRAN